MKVGLTSRWGQQAQVVMTLVTVELPLLKQEIHYLGRGYLRLGNRWSGKQEDRQDRAVGTSVQSREALRVGCGVQHTHQEKQQQQHQLRTGGLGAVHASG